MSLEKNGNEIDLDKKKEAAISKTASATMNKQNPYPSSLLNLSDLSIPRTSYEIFRWAKYWYMFDPIIAGAINALASLPVTDIIYEDCAAQDKQKKKNNEDSETLKTYRSNIEELNIQKMLIEIGINYFLYGNCIILGEKEESGDGDKSNAKWKRLTLLDPTSVFIDYNPVTGTKTYRWKVPASVERIVKNKSPKDEYDKIPEIIKESVRKGKTIILDNDLVYHFARPTDAMGDNAVWGTPMVANVIKLLMYRNVLRQAQEAIAREHIVPFRVYFMDKTASYDPSSSASANSAQYLASELMKSAQDPNYKVVSPVPVGQITMGGNGRQLLLAPEIQQVQEEILAGMNVPREFIFGGVSYSGSSVSLRILENQFRTYRLLLLDFLNNFVVKGMAKFRGEWVNQSDDDFLIKVSMSEMKMQDDAQQKQVILQLNSTGKCSDEYMLNAFGIDPAKMAETIQAEKIKQIERDTEIQLATIKAQAKLQKAQMQMGQPPEMYEDSPAGPTEQVPEQGTEQAGNEVPTEAEEAVQGEFDAIAVAKEIAKMSDMDAANAIGQIPPQHKEKVVLAANIIKNATKNKPGVDMRPLPEKLPPRRQS